MAGSIRPKSILAAVRTTAFTLVCTAVIGASGSLLVGCDPKDPTVAEYLQLSGMKDLSRIRIGILADSPLLGERVNGGYAGFDIEIGRYIAQSLGFQIDGDRDIQWVPTSQEDRERLIQENRADLVIATYSITKERRERIRFAGPYLITQQELLVNKAMVGKIQNMADLEKLQIEVCLPGATTAVVNFSGYNLRAVPDVTGKLCMEGMISGKYQVFSTDEVVLAGYNYSAGNEFVIVHVPIEFTEQYGIAMSKDAPYLQALVEHYLAKSFDQSGTDSPWQQAWDKTLKKGNWPSAIGRHQPRPEISVRLRDADDKDQRTQATIVPFIGLTHKRFARRRRPFVDEADSL